MRPPVHLPAWSDGAPSPAAPFTTVTSWWGREEQDWIHWNGELHNNEKRTAFLEYLELPGVVDIPLELAVPLTEEPVDRREQARLEANGWRVRPIWNVDWTPAAYREYVRGSRGEFSCAKPMYSRLATGLIFPRTLHYLASGRPAVVQHTGPTRHLPHGEGVWQFRNIEEARAGLEAVAQDYERHSKAARHLAEEHFDGREIAREVLDLALS